LSPVSAGNIALVKSKFFRRNVGTEVDLWYSYLEYPNEEEINRIVSSKCYLCSQLLNPDSVNWQKLFTWVGEYLASQ